MPKFKNISTGDRGLYTTDGLLMVPAGATTDDVTLAENETPNEEWFAKAGSAAAKADPLDHDADGVRGGSLPGAESTRARGAKGD